MSPARRPSSSSVRSRSAIRRASARRHGWSPPCARPSRGASSSQPCVPVTSSSTGGWPGGRADVEQPQRAVLVDRELLAARPAAAMKRAPSSGANAALSDVQQLLAAAEVDRQAADLARVELRRPAAEDVHVRVPEAVDRLELVADREQVVALERPQDAELDRVRVLELVDHDQLEALRPALAGRRVVEQVAGAQLEVVEVDRRPLGLRVVVGGAVAVQQRVDERERAAGVEVRAGGPVGGRTRRGRPRTASEVSAFAPPLSSAGLSAPGHGTRPAPPRPPLAAARAPPPARRPPRAAAAARAARRTPPARLGPRSRGRRRPPSPGRAARPLSPPPGPSGRAPGAAAGSTRRGRAWPRARRLA